MSSISEIVRPEDVERVLEEYDQQVDSGIISPVLDCFGSIEFPRRLLTHRDEIGLFKGAMAYEIVTPDDARYFGDFVDYIWLSDGNVRRGDSIEANNIPGLERYSFQKPLAWITVMESFRKGEGTAMVNRIKSQDIEGMFLFSVPRSVGFYKKVGFQNSNMYLDAELTEPIMTWMKGGEGE